MSEKIEVDLWKTGAHAVNIGIKKQEIYKAKSRQFTTDTDIIGEFNGATEGNLTIRKNPWEAGENEQRLVMKIFTESMNWKGSLEEMVALGISRTLASDEGMPVFTLNLTNHEHLVRLERIFKPKSMNKNMYSFMFVEDEEVIPYRIEADRMTLGSDWDVLDKHNNKVAKIDGSSFNIGGKWNIDLKNDKFDLHPALDEVLVLFCGMLKYEDDVRKRLESNSKKLKKTKEGFDVVISSEEGYLYENPRRVKY